MASWRGEEIPSGDADSGTYSGEPRNRLRTKFLFSCYWHLVGRSSLPTDQTPWASNSLAQPFFYGEILRVPGCILA